MWVLLLVAGFIALLYYLVSQPFGRAPPSRKRFDQQAVVVKGPRRLGEGEVYRAPECGENGPLIDCPSPDVCTLYDVFQCGLKLNPSGRCLGVRDASGVYQWQTYRQVAARVSHIGSALRSRGAVKGTMVAIYCTNGPEFAIAVQACNEQSLVAVPLYDTLGVDACQFVINQTAAPFLIVGEKQLPTLRQYVGNCPKVELVVSLASAGVAMLKDLKPTVSFAAFEEEGKAKPVAPNPPQPQDTATICYTSGTTGDPKGVVVTHRSLTADLAGVKARIELLQTERPLDHTDVHISYLPMAHMFERLIQEMIYLVGASVGFYAGDANRIFEDITALRPTIFVSVPRIYTRLYDRVLASVHAQSWLSRFFFHWALRAKRANLPDHVVTHWLWDWLVFQKIRDRLGGRVRLMVTGAAPLRDEVMSFLRCAFSCTVVEGYGQTENAAAATATIPGDCSLGHVGPPLPCVEIKLIDVPDMLYFSSDIPRPRGEVCLRGPVVFSRYFVAPHDSESPIDEHGWLHTGDIGTWNANGTLSIIDRRKNIFKLAQGEYVAPEKIESVYLGSPFVSQIFVHGNSLEASVVAVVVPDEPQAMEFARANGLAASNLAALCTNNAFIEAVVFDMKLQAAKCGLKGFETAQAVHLTPTEFSAENGLLTSTFKLKRPLAQKMFQREIAAMYAKLKAMARG